MPAWDRSLTFLSASLLIAVSMFALSALMATAARAADPSSVFYYESEPGNDFGKGTADYITSDEANFGTFRGAVVYIDGTSWSIGAAGPGGAKLVAGTTYADVRDSGHETAPWFDLNSQRMYSHCWNVDGDFTVHDVGYYGTMFSRLSLSFAVTCEGQPAVVRGELRFNTSAPAFDGVALSPVITRSADLGYGPIGGHGDPQTFTLTNVGAGPVSVGAASMSGADAGDFEVVADTCAGLASLAPGATCSFDARTAPTTNGDLEADASIPVGTTVTTRQVSVNGIGQTATTTTISGPSGWVWPPVGIVAQTSPSPTTTDGGSSIWYTFPDTDTWDGPIGGPEPMMADGSAPYQGTIPPGVHRVYAEFNPNGTGTWASSTSETITVKVMRASSIRLTSSLNPTNGDEPPVVTARLQPNDFMYQGGELVLTDVTTGEVLERVDVGPSAQQIRIEPFLTSGDHLLRAEYDGYEGVQGSSAELTQTIRVNAGATIAPGKIYPYVDRYLDELRIETWRYHPVLIEISIDSVASGETVRTEILPPETEDILWNWDGKDDDGLLVPAGKYKVKVAFDDGGSDPKVVSKTVTVSRKKVNWKTKSVTLKGNAYQLAGKTRNATISKSGSNYGSGVRLTSGKGSAIVGHAFPVAKADVYGKIKFKVNGRSTNGHKAIIAVWNPAAGGYKYVGNYDAAKFAGPGMKWWQTAVPVNDDRVRNGKVRTIVMVGKGFGKAGSAVFDVKSVKLVYEVGTLVAPPSAAVDEELAEDSDPAAPSSEIVGLRASQLLGAAPRPTLRSVGQKPAAAVAPAAGPVEATGPSAFAMESQHRDAGLASTPDWTFSTATEWMADIAFVEATDGWATMRLSAAGPNRARLQPGQTYVNSTDRVVADRPYLLIASWGGCDTACGNWGDFTVHDVAYDAEGRFERLSLSFDLRCGATGEVRFNTMVPDFKAIEQVQFCLVETDQFPDTQVGETSAPIDRSITNVGTGAVTFGPAGIVGEDPDQFEIVTDTCSGTTLSEGASCQLMASFDPGGRGYHTAAIGMDMDFGSGARMIDLFGNGVVATTTTLTAPTGTTIEPVRLEAQVTPNPAAGASRGVNVYFRFPDDPSRDTYVRSDLDGYAVADVWLLPGDHRVYAWFPEHDDFQESQSGTVTLHVGGSAATSIELTADPTTVVASQRPTITATLSPAGIPGGELRIENSDTGELFGSMTVSPGDQQLVVTPLLGEPDRYTIVARYLGHEQYGKSWRSVDVRVEVDEDVDGSVKVEPAVFYPTVDGFRDSTGITVKRGERLAVEAKIVADVGGVVHFDTSAPVGTSDVAFSWDGSAAGGEMAPSGYYTLRVKLTDEVPNTEIIERRIVLSHDWVEWTPRTATVWGKDYSLVGKTKDAAISRSDSAYAKGVRIKSKKGSATVGYTFPVAKARLYGDMTYEVEGRSTNGHQAAISLWNPELGGYRDLSHYDAAKIVGPAYAKWTTSASGAHRVSDGKARGVVSTWNGLGAPYNAVFDIKVVRLHYETGAVQRVTDWSLASTGPKANLAADYLADADTGRKGRVVKWMGGKKLPKWMRIRPTGSDQPRLAETPMVDDATSPDGPPEAPALRPYPKTVSAVPAARKLVSAWTCPAADRSPFGPDRTPGTRDDECDPVVAEWSSMDEENVRLNKRTGHSVLVQLATETDNRLIVEYADLSQGVKLTAKPRPTGTEGPPLFEAWVEEQAEA